MSSTIIGFTGDFSFSGYFQHSYTDDALIDQAVLDYLNDCDAAVINFESPITPSRQTSKPRLAHRSDPAALDYVQRHFRHPVLSLANNHMMDYGKIGMMDTLELVRSRHVEYIGAGESEAEAAKWVIIGQDVKIGILAAHNVNAKYAEGNTCGPLHCKSRNVIRSAIEALRKEADYVVMVCHGGDEFYHAPMPDFRRKLRGYLDMGCDVVVAHHPHVVQGYESFGSKMIFYSLGNFLFDTDYQRIQKDTDQGVLLRLSFTPSGFTFDSLPVSINRSENRVYRAEGNVDFADVHSVYGRLWAAEASRRKDIAQKRQTILSREEARAAEERAKKLERAQSIRKKYGLEAFEPEPESAPTTYARILAFLKALYAKATNVHALVLRLGGLKARLLHNHT